MRFRVSVLSVFFLVGLLALIPSTSYAWPKTSAEANCSDGRTVTVTERSVPGIFSILFGVSAPSTRGLCTEQAVASRIRSEARRNDVAAGIDAAVLTRIALGDVSKWDSENSTGPFPSLDPDHLDAYGRLVLRNRTDQRNVLGAVTDGTPGAYAYNRRDDYGGGRGRRMSSLERLRARRATMRQYERRY